MEVEQQREHFFAGGVVQVAGWFIAQQQAWLMNQSPCNGDTLLFAPGKLSWIMLQPVGKAYRLKHRKGLLAGIRLPGDFQRQTNVPKCSQAR